VNESTEKLLGVQPELYDWAYRIFEDQQEDGRKYGLKKVFIKKETGDIVDFVGDFVISPVFDSPKQLKQGLDTMLSDLNDSREGSMVLEDQILISLLKGKQSVNVLEDIYYG
jgi:hypothetical protein